MARILAIEADPRRRRLLTALIRERVKAHLTIVESVGAAIRSMTEQPPDLILAPTLLSPQDSEELTGHVRQLHAAPYVQMLTMSALDMLVEPPTEKRRALGLLRRRPITIGLQYDPHMVAAQIADGLDRAREARAEYEAALAYDAWRAATVAPNGDEMASVLKAPASDFKWQPDDERRVARRNAPSDVPWLSAVRLSSGLDLQLVNISSSGLLVESGSKLAPGVAYDVQLNGPDTSLIVKARFVRSEVARVDRFGVRYHAAAQFEQELEILARRERSLAASTAQQALGNLLASVLAGSDDQREPAGTRFARGLRELVGAREVLVRSAPVAPMDGTESIYFHVKGEGPSRAIMQVMFERDQRITASEFRLLKAGACLTAAVLELEDPLATGPSVAVERARRSLLAFSPKTAM